MNGARAAPVFGGKGRPATAPAKGGPRSKSPGKPGFKAAGGGNNAAGATATTNPFERHSNARLKNVVLNRKVKGAERNVAAARSKAVETRNKTLLKEYQSLNKANSFVDRRFGEKVSGMTMEEKMLARRVRVRQHHAKRNSVFALDDGGEEMELTHRGQTLTNALGDATANADDYIDDDDEDMGALDAEYVSRANFGGGGMSRAAQYMSAAEAADPNRPKTRTEILQEIVAKSKMYKAERAREKLVQDQMLSKLDDQLGDIQSLLGPISLPKKGKKSKRRDDDEDGDDNDDASDHDSDAGSLDNSKTAKPRSKSADDADEHDEYDELVKSLLKDARDARASDRLRTPEELAKVERERLERLERERLARMNPDAAAPDVPTVESLGDDFGFVGSDHEAESNADDSSAASSDDEEKDEDAAEGASGDDSDAGDDVSHGTGDDDTKEANDGSMPFVVACPTSVQALHHAIESYVSSPEDVAELFKRIRTCHSIHLAAQNRPKQLALFSSSLQYALEFHGDSLKLEFLSAMLPHLFDIAQENGDAVARICLDRLQAMQKKLKPSSMLADEHHGWPSFGELVVLRWIGHLFPVTDFSHPVVTPLLLYIGQCLALCPVTSYADAVRGLFVATLGLQYTAEAKRIMPEVLGFLTGMVMFLSPATTREELAALASTTASAAESCWERMSWLRTGVSQFNERKDDSEVPGLLLEELDSHASTTATATQCAALTASTCRLVERCIHHWSSNEGFPEAMSVLVRALHDAAHAIKKGPIGALVAQTHKSLKRACKQCVATRPLLQLQAEAMKPKPIPQYDPLMEEDYNMTKDDPVTRQVKQLKRQVKRQKRAVGRELRKDSAFIARVREEEAAAVDKERVAKGKEFMAFLQKQQQTFNDAIKQGTAHGGGAHAAKRKVKLAL